MRDVIVAENQFSDHDDGGLGIQIYPSASGVLIGNVLSDCGTWCILDNSISIGAGHHTSAAILVLGGDVQIDGNRITGGEKDTATNDPFQRFSLDQGLEILDASAQVTGNAIRKAAVGIATGDSDVSGADNVLDRVHAAFSLFGGSVASARS